MSDSHIVKTFRKHSIFRPTNSEFIIFYIKNFEWWVSNLNCFIAILPTRVTNGTDLITSDFYPVG